MARDEQEFVRRPALVPGTAIGSVFVGGLVAAVVGTTSRRPAGTSIAGAFALQRPGPGHDVGRRRRRSRHPRLPTVTNSVQHPAACGVEERGPVIPLRLARALLGGVFLWHPPTAPGLDDRARVDRVRVIVRLLGARHLAQAAMTTTPRRMRLGMALDGLHLLSLLVVAVVAAPWRRLALVDAAVAATWVRHGRARQQEMSHDTDPYPPIGDYAFIGDCHSAALVSKDGVDRLVLHAAASTAGSIFGRLLDWDAAGSARSRPTARPTSRARVPRRHAGARDHVPHARRRGAGDRLLRDAQGRSLGAPPTTPPRRSRATRGRMRFAVDVVPALRLRRGAAVGARHDHGERCSPRSAATTPCSSQCDHDLDRTRRARHRRVAFAVARRRAPAVCRSPAYPPEEIDLDAPDPISADRRSTAASTRRSAWWRRVDEVDALAPTTRCRPTCAVPRSCSRRSPTRPPAPSRPRPRPRCPRRSVATRNWDYRYSWIRDSQFTVRSLARDRLRAREPTGSVASSSAARPGAPSRCRSCTASAASAASPRSSSTLEGYRGSRPVRVGNAAAAQLQLDVYGDAARPRVALARARPLARRRLLALPARASSTRAAERWKQPDQGMWEVRGEPRHFVHSKVDVLGRARPRAAPRRGLPAPGTHAQVARRPRRASADAVEERGYDKRTRHVRPGVRLDRSRRRPCCSCPRSTSSR